MKVFVAFGGKEEPDPAISEKLIGLIRQVETNFHAAGYDDPNFRFVVDPTPCTPRLPGKSVCPAP